MSPEKEIRPTANGTDQVPAGSSNGPSVTATGANKPEPIDLIGFTVEKVLDATLWRLRSGEISLEDLTPALASFFLDGHASALASVLPELTRVEQERDQARSDAERYYRAAFSPRQPVKIGKSYAEIQAIRAEIYSGGAK